MQVFIILKRSPDSIPRIQVSGVTSIAIHILFLIIVQTETLRDEHVYKSKSGLSQFHWFQNNSSTFLFLIIYISLIFHKYTKISY
jgi:hypothetical protein